MNMVLVGRTRQRTIYREKVLSLGDRRLWEGKGSDGKHDSGVGAPGALGTKNVRRTWARGTLMSFALAV